MFWPGKRRCSNSCHRWKRRCPRAASTVALLGEELNSDPHEPVLVRDQVLSDISRIIDRVDPSIVFVELPSVGGRLDEELANALRAFSALPAENMLRIEPIDPSSQTVHVRWGTKDGHLCVSMISLAPWPSEVELETSAPIEWASRDDADPTASRVSIEQISAKRAGLSWVRDNSSSSNPRTPPQVRPSGCGPPAFGEAPKRWIKLNAKSL